MMNIRHISERTWHTISNEKNITLSELATKLNMSIEIVALAVGWLAAEGKVDIGENGSAIELSPKNYHPIYFG